MFCDYRGLLFVLFSLPFITVADDFTVLKQRVSQLEQQVQQLQQQLIALQTQLNVPPMAAAPSNPVFNANQSQQLQFTRWFYRQVQVKFNTYHALDVELHNGFAKGIRELDARIDFKNLRGEHLYSVAITSQLSIPAGESVVDEGSAQNKRLLGRRHPMMKNQPDDVRVVLIVRKVVFDDGSIIAF